MRGVLKFVAAVLVAVAAIWLVRPAGVGDPGGLIALADTTLPQAAALRLQYFPWAVKTALAGATAATTGTGPGTGSGTGTGGGKGGGKSGPVAVLTKPVQQKAIPTTFAGVGTVQAIASIAIRPHLDGQILEVGVAEGALVKQGDRLFRLDDRSLKAQLAQADAVIRKDQVTLEQNGRDLTRAQDLLKQKFLTPQSRETAQTAVDQIKAQIAVDTAQKAGIETSLSFMEIDAPVAGRIGSIAAKTGSFARAGDTLATINQIDPIYVTFALPQARLADVRAAMAKDIASVRIKDAPGAPAGKVAFIENSVDAATGTVQVKASMPNPGEALWPGAFTAVELQTGVDEAAIVVPSVAVLLGQNGPYVYAVVDKKAVLKPISVARTSGSDTIVTAGVAMGDNIVVQGQGGLTDGAEVRSLADAPAKPDKALKTSSAEVSKDG